MKSVHSKTETFYVLAVLRYVLNCDRCNCRGAIFRAQSQKGATTSSICAPTMERGERHERDSQICRHRHCRRSGTTVLQKSIYYCGCSFGSSDHYPCCSTTPIPQHLSAATPTFPCHTASATPGSPACL